jgi:hypothetical protein
MTRKIRITELPQGSIVKLPGVMPMVRRPGGWYYIPQVGDRLEPIGFDVSQHEEFRVLYKAT